MATLKAVLGRHEEKLNLRNASLCVVLVILLVCLAFGLFTIKPLLQETTDSNHVETHAAEVRVSN